MDECVDGIDPEIPWRYDSRMAGKRVRERRYRGAVDSGCNNLFSRATRATKGARLIPREEASASSFQYLRSR